MLPQADPVGGFSHNIDTSKALFDGGGEEKEGKGGGSARLTLIRHDGSSTLKPRGSISRIFASGGKFPRLNSNLLQRLKRDPCLEAELKPWQVRAKKLPDSSQYLHLSSQ